MTPLTFVLVAIIAICFVFTILFNSLTAKLGRVESKQTELETHFKKRFELSQELVKLQETEAEKEKQEVLQNEIFQIEEILTSSQESFTAAVKEYNESISRFPCILIAQILGFKTIAENSEEIGS
ncbi:MAG: LemA family protein [Defluviitaleaceae bacterium]|nr:LemA family protein [Defluviitaleaceae bacterium]